MPRDSISSYVAPQLFQETRIEQPTTSEKLYTGAAFVEQIPPSKFDMNRFWSIFNTGCALGHMAKTELFGLNLATLRYCEGSCTHHVATCLGITRLQCVWLFYPDSYLCGFFGIPIRPHQVAKRMRGLAKCYALIGK